MSIRIFKGSILDAPVDLIVNPANSFMRHGGGLAKIIDTAAMEIHQGPTAKDWDRATVKELKTVANPARNAYQEHRLRTGLIAVGDAITGPPGALCKRFKGIVHAVGPIWGGGGFYERELLYSAYRRSLEAARERRMDIALPAISAGIFGVPIDVVADAALQAAITHLLHAISEACPEFDIYFALMDDEHIEAFQKAFRDASYGVLKVVTP